jgi:CBS domain-containing protein
MSLIDAARFFAEEASHRSYPVVDARGRLLGLVSRGDALEWKVGGRGDGRLGDTLSDASTRFAFRETPCGEVADMMVETGVGRVPIIEHQDRRVVGIISRQDLLKVRTRQKSVEQR